MKKFMIFCIIVVIGISLFAENHDIHPSGEIDPFNTFRNDQTKENFFAAVDHFSQPENSDNLMLAYLYYIQLENTLKDMETDLPEMNNRTKFQYANLLLTLNRFDESIKVYDQLNEEVPDWSCPWRHKGEAYFKAGDLVQAEIALKKSIETRIEHFDAYVMLAEVQKEAGNYKEALETLETGLTYKGKDIEDPEEEVDMDELEILHQELIELNK